MIKDDNGTVQLSINIGLSLSTVFESFLEEFKTALNRFGVYFEEGPSGGIMQGTTRIGQVLTWEPEKRIVIEWMPVDWRPEESTKIEMSWEAIGEGTRLSIEHRGWDIRFGDGRDLLGWFVSEAAAPLFHAMGPKAFGDWMTDRGARRPMGAPSREVYRDPLFHYPNFKVILSELALTEDDYLIEVGCGGGALLKEALQSGCRAAAIDHSPDMVRVAREENRQAVDSGRLEVLEASADQLPFPDEKFTHAAMTSVLGFLPDPVAVFAEMRRVLSPNGLLVVQGSDPELKGTIGAPEPMASRLHFYNNEGLRNIAKDAGFDKVTIIRRNLEPYAKEVGIPEEYLSLFSEFGARFVLARKG